MGDKMTGPERLWLWFGVALLAVGVIVGGSAGFLDDHELRQPMTPTVEPTVYRPAP